MIFSDECRTFRLHAFWAHAVSYRPLVMALGWHSIFIAYKAGKCLTQNPSQRYCRIESQAIEGLTQ